MLIGGRWDTRRRRDNRWKSQPELRTIIEFITRSQTDADMVRVKLGDGQSIQCSAAYVRNLFELEQLFERHDLLVDIEVPVIRGMLAALGVDVAEWTDDEQNERWWQ